eukprot:1845934-Prymnesium_polylepis.1
MSTRRPEIFSCVGPVGSTKGELALVSHPLAPRAADAALSRQEQVGAASGYVQAEARGDLVAISQHAISPRGNQCRSGLG